MTPKGQPLELSSYRMMWLYVMFDLPVGTKAERKTATAFRNFLLHQGFEMAQYSVYIRFAASREIAETHITKISNVLPERGNVHILTITDTQYAGARIFTGTKREPKQEKPEQLLLF